MLPGDAARRRARASAAAIAALAATSLAGCTSVLGLDGITYESDDAAIFAPARTPAWASDLPSAGEASATGVALAPSGAIFVTSAATLWRSSAEVADAAATPIDGSVTGVTVTAAGDPIVVGSSSRELSAGGARAPLVAQLSANGELAWVTDLGSSGSGSVAAVAADDHDAIWVAGAFMGSLSVAGAELRAPSTTAFAARLDAGTGVAACALALPQLGRSRATAVAALPSGGALVGGWVDSGRATSRGGFVVEVDASGSPLWRATFDGPGRHEVRGVALTAARHVVVLGTFDRLLELGSTQVELASATRSLRGSSAGGSDVFVAELDADGAPVWLRTFGGPGADDARALAVDERGSIFIAGSFEGEATFGGLAVRAAGGSDGFVGALSASGEPTWVTSLGGAGDDAATALAVRADVIAARRPDAEPRGHTIVVAGTHGARADLGARALEGASAENVFLAAYLR